METTDTFSSATFGQNTVSGNVKGVAAASEPTDAEIRQANFARHRIGQTRYTHFHIVAFVLTFACNTFVHASRKSLGNVKSVISEEWTPSSFTANSSRPKEPDDIWNDHTFFPNDNDPGLKTFLGGLDTAFMISYAIGLFFSGPIGDRINLRYLLCIGLFGNALTVFLFACVGEWFELYSVFWYMPLWILNGLFQSTCMPSVVAIMGSWFGKSNRGLIFGLWSSNSSVGNVIGSVLVAAIVNYGYDVAMLVPAVLVFAMGIIMFFGLTVDPNEVMLPLADNENVKANRADDTECIISDSEVNLKSYGSGARIKPVKEKNKAIGFFEALLLPGVIIYSVAYAGVKLVHYSFFYWLPFYLSRQFQWTASEADNLSSWYDVGGIFGAIAGGYASDKLKRSPVLATMLLIAIPILFVYQDLPADPVINSLVLAIIGFFIGGVVNVMSAAIAADLGKQPKLKGNESALATVTGILDGFGSIGAALGQLLVPAIQDWIGWDAVFYLFMICLFLTFLSMLPIVHRELKEANFWQKLRHCSFFKKEEI